MRTYNEPGVTYNMPMDSIYNTYNGVVSTVGTYNWGTYNYPGIGDDGFYDDKPDVIGFEKGKQNNIIKDVKSKPKKGLQNNDETNIISSLNI